MTHRPVPRNSSDGQTSPPESGDHSDQALIWDKVSCVSRFMLVFLAACATTGCANSASSALGDSVSGQDAFANAASHVTDGRLYLHPDGEIRLAIALNCAKIGGVACAADGSTPACVAAEAFGMGMTVPCKTEVLAYLAASTAAAWHCDIKNHAALTDPSALDAAMAALGSCYAANVGEGQGTTCSVSSINSTPVGCEVKAIAGHNVKLKCDGSQCTCWIDDVSGASAPDPKADQSGAAYANLLQSQCLVIQ